jgi:hypothetical protein
MESRISESFIHPSEFFTHSLTLAATILLHAFV